MKLYTYIFFQFKNYYNQLWEAIIAFIALIAINVLSLLFVMASIFDFDPGFYLTGDYFTDRFIKIPLFFILPISIIVFIFYIMNKIEIEEYFEEFKGIRNRRLNTQMIFYIVFSGLFLIFSIISSTLLYPY